MSKQSSRLKLQEKLNAILNEDHVESFYSILNYERARKILSRKPEAKVMPSFRLGLKKNKNSNFRSFASRSHSVMYPRRVSNLPA